MSKRSNGEGSIFRRKDGRWCASYYDDSFKRHYIYGKTKTEVRKKLNEKLKMKKYINQDEYLFQDWIEKFLKEYKKNELKITTFDSYMIVFRRHIVDSSIGKKKLVDVKTEDLQQFYNQKIKEGYNSKTVRAIEVIINISLDKAYKLRMIPENPNLFTSIPKKIKYEADVLSFEDVRNIVQNSKDDELYPIVVTTVYTGMRKGEVMALKWSNVDFDDRKIYVRNSLCRVVNSDYENNGEPRIGYKILEPKTKKSIRMIPMLDEVYEALMVQKKRQDVEKETYSEIYTDQDLVFADPTGGFIPQRQFMDKYHHFLEKYGIRKIRFHDLRHTFASLLIETDVPMKVVQELLGHSTITTSMDIYTHVSDKKKEQSIRKLEERGKDSEDDENDDETSTNDKDSK